MKKFDRKIISIFLSAVMAFPAILATPFSAFAKDAVEWTAVASSDFTQASSAVSNGSLGELPTYNNQGNKMTWSTSVWTESGNASKSADGAIYIPDGYMYLSGYSGGSVPITGLSRWKIDFGFRFKTSNSGDDKYYNSDEYCFMKTYVYKDNLTNPNTKAADDANAQTKNSAFCHFAQNANGVCYSWEDDGHNVGTQSQATSITTGNGALEAGVNYHYVAEFTGAAFNAYITDDSGNIVQDIVHTKDEYFLGRLGNSSWATINSMCIGDDDNSYFFKGLEYRNITFYSGDRQMVWSPLASSDFTQATAVTNGSLGQIATYNNQGNAMTWQTGVYAQNGNASNSSDGAIYIPDGYMYLSGYSGGSVPITGHSKWKIDFGFRFKNADSANYYNSDEYSFLKMYVYTSALSNPANKNAAYCYFAQNANGVCYSWENDGHNAGTQSQGTSLCANNGNLSVGVNYHYVAEFNGSSFKAYVTDDSGNVVQNIVYTKEETFIGRLNNINDIPNTDNDIISAIKIGDDDNAYYFKGLEYRNITFYSGAEEEAIHFDMRQRETLYKGSTGFLYGEAEINVPSIDLLTGLQPDTMVQKAYGGKQHPTGDAIRTSSALLESGVKDMQIYLQDYYLEWPYDAPIKDDTIDLDSYQETVESILYKMICDEVPQGTSGAFRGSDGKYYKLNDTANNYSYVLFNEPDQIWYSWNLAGLEAAWKKIYDAVHAIDPNARCAGPNFAGYNKEDYTNFLSYCYDNNCLPELITWHELGDVSMTDFNKHYDEIKAMQKQFYTSAYASKAGRSYQPELLVNEYARHYDIGAPGGLVKWLAMFEDKDMSGCMAYWAMANTLNEMAADQNSPSSTWWVYHWYAQMTGEQCPLVAPRFSESRFYGLTSYDEDINTAYVLFGGKEEKNSTETVYLDNLNFTNLANNKGAVNVKLYAVSFSGQLGANYKPEVVFEGTLGTEDNSLRIDVQNTDEMQAYFAVITKPENNVSASSDGVFEYPVLSYEAEDAELIGGATAYDKLGWATFATSGRKDVGSINNNGDGVEFTINVPENGKYKASLFYSIQAPYVNPETLVPDANGQNRGIGQMLPYGVKLDGASLDNIYLESTVVWAYKSHYDLELDLTAGQHTLRFTHINGNDGDKGNLQLVAAMDKLDIARLDGEENNFEICLNEMNNFKEGNSYRVTAVAPAEGYYEVTADGSFSLKKQCIDYASDAQSFSTCSVYDTPVSDIVFLAKGANTLVVSGDSSKLTFTYQSDKTENKSAVINAEDMTLAGNNPTLKNNSYAKSGKVISELGIGQNPAAGDKGEDNYVSFTYNASSEGMYNFSIRYSNDEPAPIMEKADGSTYIHPYNIDLVERYAQISVNGGEPETVYFKNTLSWDTFRTVNVQLELQQGENEIKIYNDNSYQFSNLVNSTAPEIDLVTVSKLSYSSDANNGYSLTLEDEIDVNFFIDTEFYEAEGGYITYSYLESPDSKSAKRAEYTIDDSSEQLVIQPDGRRKLIIDVAPAQLAEEFTIDVYNSAGEKMTEESITASIANYCQVLLSSDAFSDYHDVANALLDYGQAANEYFDYSTVHAQEVGGAYSVPTSANYSAQLTEAESSRLSSEATSIYSKGNVALRSIAYVALLNPELRFYIDNSITEAQAASIPVSVTGGLNAQMVKTNNGICVMVTGMKANGFGDEFTLTIGTTELTYNGYAYLKSVLNSSSANAEIKQLAKCIYRYAAASETTFLI